MHLSSEKIYVEAQGVGKDYPIRQNSTHFLWRKLFKNKTEPSEEKIHRALASVSFSLKAGQSLGIIGRNGSGKSTLLQLIAGTLNPTRGTVKTQGRIASILELGVGFHPDFTGRENAFMQLAMLGIDRNDAQSRIADIEAFAEIGKFFEEPTKTYSSGMLVRLAFAVLAHSEPEILIVDEALAVGDAQFVQKCLRFINDFRKKGILLFVSHSTATVRTYCEHAIWIDGGKIRQSGPSNEVTEAYIEAFFNENNKRVEAYSAAEEPQKIEASRHKQPTTTIAAKQAQPIDARRDFLLNSNLRNDIQIFGFDEEKSDGFGKKGAEIIHCALVNSENQSPLSWTVGGEPIAVEIHAACYQAMKSPIIGFLIRNSVGLEIFGDNTFLTTQENEQPIAKPGDTLRAHFEFYMPILPEGDYTLTVAIAEGDETKHIQHHWIHDAIAFRSTSTSSSTGLVGIPMQAIDLEILKD